MFWELYQQHQISTAQDTARRASNRTASFESRLSRVEDRVDSLALACQAMWELLGEHLSHPSELLQQKMQEIDARDGKVDGKMGRMMTHCPKCRRPLHARHRNCMYCGEEVRSENMLQR